MCEFGGTICRRSGVEKDVFRQYFYINILKFTLRSWQAKSIKKRYSVHNFINSHAHALARAIFSSSYCALCMQLKLFREMAVIWLTETDKKTAISCISQKCETYNHRLQNKGLA